MRNKNFDADLLKTLNEQPMPAAPLTDDEFARVLDAACAIINDMATFDEAGIDDGYLDEIREGDKFTVEGAQ